MEESIADIKRWSKAPPFIILGDTNKILKIDRQYVRANNTYTIPSSGQNGVVVFHYSTENAISTMDLLDYFSVFTKTSHYTTFSRATAGADITISTTKDTHYLMFMIK